MVCFHPPLPGTHYLRIGKKLRRTFQLFDKAEHAHGSFMEMIETGEGGRVPINWKKLFWNWETLALPLHAQFWNGKDPGQSRYSLSCCIFSYMITICFPRGAHKPVTGHIQYSSSCCALPSQSTFENMTLLTAPTASSTYDSMPCFRTIKSNSYIAYQITFSEFLPWSSPLRPQAAAYVG